MENWGTIKINNTIFDFTGTIMSCPRPRTRVYYGKFATIYEPREYKKWKNRFAELYKEQCNKNFGDRHIKVMIDLYFKAPKTMQKYKEQVLQIACRTRKDIDNCAKAVLDALIGTAYVDDRQVISLLVNKYWTNEEEKIIVRIDDAYECISEEEFKKQWKKQKQ